MRAGLQNEAEKHDQQKPCLPENGQFERSSEFANNIFLLDTLMGPR